MSGTVRLSEAMVKAMASPCKVEARVAAAFGRRPLVASPAPSGSVALWAALGRPVAKAAVTKP